VFFVGSPTGGMHFMIEGGYKLHPRLRAAELARERWDDWSMFPIYSPGILLMDFQVTELHATFAESTKSQSPDSI
jgi:hypothetical protein